MKNCGMYGTAALLLVAASIFYIYPSIRATSLMYEYSAKMRRLEKEKELNKKLLLESSTLASYDRLEKKAIGKLGLVLPGPGQVVIIAKK